MSNAHHLTVSVSHGQVNGGWMSQCAAAPPADKARPLARINRPAPWSVWQTGFCTGTCRYRGQDVVVYYSDGNRCRTGVFDCIGEVFKGVKLTSEQVRPLFYVICSHEPPEKCHMNLCYKTINGSPSEQSCLSFTAACFHNYLQRDDTVSQPRVQDFSKCVYW